MNTNYYTILEIEKSASDKEVKTAFRKLAHKHHPDKGGDEKKFKEINEAYQTLSNKEKRSQYDTFGSASSNFGGAGNGFGQGGFSSRGGPAYDWNMNYGDFARSASGTQFTGQLFKKKPGWAWLFLLPLIIGISLLGLVLVFVWIVFSTARVVFSRSFGR